jgi:hypothetical protein
MELLMKMKHKVECEGHIVEVDVPLELENLASQKLVYFEPPVWQPVTCPDCGKHYELFNRCCFNPELFKNPIVQCHDCWDEKRNVDAEHK